MMASAIYLINDVLDVDKDRAHPEKRHRPIASGELAASTALFIAVTLASGALALASLLTPPLFLITLTLYLAATTAYSLLVKRLLLLDVAFLTLLYNLRLLGGGVAVDVPLSPWLLGLSLFLFTSLALAKRYTEVAMVSREGSHFGAFGRAYQTSDLPVLGTAGVASGVVSALVLSLYITGDSVIALYSRPEYLWLTAFLLLFWVLRLWILAYRQQLTSDPVVFAFRDRISLIMGGAVVGCFLLAY